MNKACGCDRIPVELIKILKDDAIKVLHSICQQIWKTQNLEIQIWKTPGHRTGRSAFIPIPKKSNAKRCSNYQKIVFISLASKVMPFKLGFSSTWTEKFHMHMLDLKMAEEPEIKLPTSTESFKRQESSRKTSTSALLTMPKPLTVWKIHNQLWKILKEMGIPDHLNLPPEKSVRRSRSNS